MKKEWEDLKRLIKQSHVVVEVVDSRDIEGTRLPVAERMAGTNRLLVLANKADLLHEGDVPEVPRKGILVSAKETDEKQRRELIGLILAKTASRPVKALFIGYPNVGKSSLINMLAHRKAAKVSSVAGTTRNVQWVRVSDELRVTDYRGLYPKQPRGELVRKGAINVSEDAERFAHDFAARVLENPKLRAWLEEKYDMSLEDAKDSEDVLVSIAKRRNWYVKGGELNTTEAAKSLVRAMKEAPEI
jgi:ribosome biogenesis GTPase A